MKVNHLLKLKVLNLGVNNAKTWYFEGSDLTIDPRSPIFKNWDTRPVTTLTRPLHNHVKINKDVHKDGMS